MKKVFVKLALVLLSCALMMTFVGCDISALLSDFIHTHEYTEEITKAPTCNEEGVKTFTCSCGDKYTEVIEKVSHTVQAIPAVAPTCTASGLTAGKKCSKCGAVLEAQKTVPATGHKFDDDNDATCNNSGCDFVREVECRHSNTEVLAEVAPTCTTTGLTAGERCKDCQEIIIKQETIPALGHSYESVVTAPTCTDGGYTTYTCSCGDSYVADESSALGHSEEIIAAVAPTCTEAGLTEGKKCSVCGVVTVEQEIVPALGHSYESVVTAPTCTDGGYTTYTCSCGDSYVADEIPALGHTEETVAGKDATCTEAGLTDGKRCSVCGETLVAQEEIPAKGHTNSEIAIENKVDPTCVADGSHDEVIYCTVCETEISRETVVDAKLNHKAADEWSKENVVDPTCEDKGSYDLILYCSRCGEVLDSETIEVDALGHTAGKSVIENSTAASCGAAGSYDEVVYCTVCDKELSRTKHTVDAIPHSYNETVTKMPTCEEAGVKTISCSVCGDTYTEEIAALGHDEVSHEAKAPTCTDIGWDAYVTCSRCDYNTYIELAKIKHDYDVVVTAPTCTEAGYTTHTCSACGFVYTSDETSALGHTEVVDKEVAPTCTESGLAEGKHCSTCNEVLVAQEEIPALGHTEETVSGKDATCTETGLTEGKKCSVCGETLVAQEEIPALGHTEETVSGKDATCTETGLTEGKKCSVCGETLVAQEEIPVLGHTEETVSGKDATCTETGLTEGKKCSVCGETLVEQEVIPVIEHTYSEDWHFDDDKHWHECTACESKDAYDHIFDSNSDIDCSACGYVRIVAPVLVDSTVSRIHDTYERESVVIDFVGKVNNPSGLALTYSAKRGEEVLTLDGTSYTLILDSSSGEATFTVSISYEFNGEIETLEYTYVAVLYDSTENRLANGGFENGLEGWTVVGNIGSVDTATHYWLGDPERAEGFAFGMDGDKMFSAYAPGAEERAVGTLTSSTFKVGGSGFVTFKIGAMRDANYVYVDVVDAETKEILARYYNGLWSERTDDMKSGCTLIAYKADLSAFMGREVFFRISDNADSGYGLFFADSFVTYYTYEPDGFHYATPAPYTVSGTIYDLFNGGFEMGNVQGWWSIGEIGVVTNANGYWGDNIPYEKVGDFLFTGVESFGADTMREGNHGTLTSSVFEVGGTGMISFKLGGGGNELCCIQIIDAVTGEVLARYRQQAQRDAILIQYVADLSAHIGRTVRIQVVDYASNGWGCVSFDHVVTYYPAGRELPGNAITAINALADMSDLNAEIALEVTEQGDYTLDSYNAYLAKLNDAKALAGDDSITITQDRVNAMTAELLAARLALEVRPVIEVEGANKSFNLISGDSKEISLADYIDTNNLSNITYEVNANDIAITLSSIVDGKFTITAGTVNEESSVVVTILVNYKGEVKHTVEISVNITNDVAPVVRNDEAVSNYDVFGLDHVVLDLSGNVDNAGGLELTYSVNGTAIEGSDYTFVFGTYTDDITYETLIITVTYVANGNEETISYTYKLGLCDSTVNRLANGGFENGMDGWTVVGNVGSVSSERGYWNGDFGMDGDKMFSAYAEGASEGAVGTLTSSTFKVGGSGFVTFKIGAMRDANYVYIDVVDAETKEILARYYNGLWRENETHCTLVAYKADLSAFIGREVFFRISDNADSGYGLFFADSFVTYYESEPEGFNVATPAPYDISGTIYDIFNGSFEMGGNQGWWNQGEPGAVTGANAFFNGREYGKHGNFLYSGVEDHMAGNGREGNRGALTSSVFEIGGTGYISFMLGGGGNALCYVQVVDAVTGEILARYHQQEMDEAVLKQYIADLSAYIGRAARIQVVDQAGWDWGCVSFDNVVTYYASLEDLPAGIVANDIKGNLKYTIENGSFETGNIDGWHMNITESGAHNTLGWVESSEHDAGWYTKNDDTKDGNFLFTFCRPDGTNCENTKGTLQSSTFSLKQGAFVSFKFGAAGGYHNHDVYIELCRADGSVIARFYNDAEGKINTRMNAYFYQYNGVEVECFFRVVDNSTGDYGCLVIDDFRVNLDSAPEGYIPAIQ